MIHTRDVVYQACNYMTGRMAHGRELVVPSMTLVNILGLRFGFETKPFTVLTVCDRSVHLRYTRVGHCGV